MAHSQPIVLITGGSSGIGEALAHLFAARGHAVVLVARNEAMLNGIADAISEKGQPRPLVLPADLTRMDAGARIAEELATRGLEPAFVVNNAGFGLGGDAESLDHGKQLAMIDLNVRALTELSLRWTESIRRHKGGILNVASVAGFYPGPGMAVYFATKNYVLSFTEALHHELAPTGIRVTALCPGPVKTRFLERAGLGEAQYPRAFLVSPEQVALEGYNGLMAGQRVVVPGVANKLAGFMAGLIPHRLTLGAISAQNSRRKAQAPPPRTPKAG